MSYAVFFKCSLTFGILINRRKQGFIQHYDHKMHRVFKEMVVKYEADKYS